MKYVLKTCIFLLIGIGICHAQEFSDQDLQSLVNAERAFSQMAKEKNTRDAFITFFNDDVITSAPGNGPRKGKKYLEEQAPNEGWLHWYPVYSDIAASGDFGYNTGPWEFRAKRTDETPVAFGEFVSIWKKNAQGEWKVAVDIGISHGAPKSTPSLATSAIRLKPSKRASKTGKDELLEIERKFIGDLAQRGNTAYEKQLSNEARLYRPGREPITTQSDVQQFLSKQQSKVTYTFVDGEVASSKDLAYVYGEATVELVVNGVTKTRQCSYMRFWKKEDGKNWKIVLDLLSD